MKKTRHTVLGVDSSLRGTGYAVLTGSCPSDARCHEYGVIHIKPQVPVSGCLLEIRNSLRDIIHRHKPSWLAIESTIYVQSFRTAITLGAARGAALLAAAESGLEIVEFAPRKIKKAVVGKGAASKEQVAFMVRALLELPETPPFDAADAIATAVAFFHHREHLPARSQTP